MQRVVSVCRAKGVSLGNFAVTEQKAEVSGDRWMCSRSAAASRSRCWSPETCLVQSHICVSQCGACAGAAGRGLHVSGHRHRRRPAGRSSSEECCRSAPAARRVTQSFLLVTMFTPWIGLGIMGTEKRMNAKAINLGICAPLRSASMDPAGRAHSTAAAPGSTHPECRSAPYLFASPCRSRLQFRLRCALLYTDRGTPALCLASVPSSSGVYGPRMLLEDPMCRNLN